MQHYLQENIKKKIFIGGSNNSIESIEGKGPAWIFPRLASMARPANTVTKMLKDLYKKRNSDGSRSVLDLPEDVKGTSIRSGGAIVISNHPSCDIYHAICRGDWDLSGSCNVFEYVLPPLFETMTAACAALCGWKNARVRCYPPRCAFMEAMDDVEKDKVFRFANYIFENQHGERLDHLQTFKLTMLASLLQYLNRFIEKYGVDHVIVVSLYSKAKCQAFNFEFSTLLEWGAAVETDWKFRNVLAYSASNTVTIDSLTNALDVQRSSNAEHLKSLSNEVNRLKTEINLVKESLTAQSSASVQLIQQTQLIDRRSEELLRLMRQKVLESAISADTSLTHTPDSQGRKRIRDSEVSIGGTIVGEIEIVGGEIENVGGQSEMNKENPRRTLLLHSQLVQILVTTVLQLHLKTTLHTT